MVIRQLKLKTPQKGKKGKWLAGFGVCALQLQCQRGKKGKISAVVFLHG